VPDDYPLDWYQQEFLSYAENINALPDRFDILTTICGCTLCEAAQKQLAIHYYCWRTIIWAAKL